jgi:hypothetical protein
MKVLIINTTLEDNYSSRMLSGTDTAIAFELYKKYGCDSNRCWLHVNANQLYSKYTFIDERLAYIGSFDSMKSLLGSVPFLGNVLVLTHEQWLDKQNPKWKTEQRYQYW